MTILFFCGSLASGQDGVGDYTRRLCGELIRMGHVAQIVSLCDKKVTTFINQNQEVEEVKVAVYRIPSSSSNHQRLLWLQEIMDKVQPDWISLQFVPYSFNPKGLPFWLPKFLKKLKGKHKWHIMFHELWLGIDIESSFAHKCIGKLQQLIVENMVNYTKPSYISTQNKLYQFFLQLHTIDADILPIFGNIPVTGIKNKSNEFTQFVLFGTVHYGAPFKDFVDDLIIVSKTFKKPIKFVFIGKNGSELPTFTAILENYKICYEVLGVQSEDIISQALVNSDFGISTTPYFQTEKSGVYAAYREHQINTICVSREWTPTNGQYHIPQIIKYEKNNLNLIPMKVKLVDLNSIADQFINSICTI